MSDHDVYDPARTVMWHSPKPTARDSRGLVVEIVVEEGHDARSIGNARGLILPDFPDFGRRLVSLCVFSSSPLEKNIPFP